MNKPLSIGVAIAATVIAGAVVVSQFSSDNYCASMLDTVAASFQDQTGLKRLTDKLPGAKRACPRGVPLLESLKYVNGVLAVLNDPYTYILTPDEAKQLASIYAGKQSSSGFGLRFSSDPSKTLADEAGTDKTKRTFAFTGLVYHVDADSPAARAGILDGDTVWKLNGDVVIGQPTAAVIAKMSVETPIKLTIKRGTEEFERTVTKALFVSDNVWTRDLGNGIYAIVIIKFDQNTFSDVFNQIQKLGARARHYVLDLRNNHGGLVDDSIRTAALFIHDGVILTRIERVSGDDPANPSYNMIIYTRKGDHVVATKIDSKTNKVLDRHNLAGIVTDWDEKAGKATNERMSDVIPFIKEKSVVVIANKGTASAGEIATAALQENHTDGPNSKEAQGALFEGVKTFGKGIGGTFEIGPLNTRIAITTFIYLTPKGNWPGNANTVLTGLKPDIEVEQPPDAVPYTTTDAQLNKAVVLISGQNH